MRIIGITGPTGAGKTTALNVLEELGGAVIDCDAVYHDLLASDIALQSELCQTFGDILDAEKQIDRKKLGAIVFHDPAKLALLNQITQEAICTKVRTLINYAGNVPAIAIDAIALLESPLRELCDTTVAVIAPQEIRVARIMAREGISKDYAWSRVRAQKPDEYFIQHCEHIFVNDCASREEFADQVREKLKELIRA